MKLRSLVIPLALLAAFASDSWGQSKRPPSSSEPPSKQNTQTTAPDQRGTENMPLSVKILPGEKTTADTTKEKYEAEEKPSLDRALSAYTGWLAIFTAALFFAAAIQVGLFLWQLRLIQAAAKDTRDAADAAKLNAQAVIDAQRAHLYVTVVQHDVSETIQAGNQARYDPNFEKIAMHAPILAYIFRNAGKTPAILEEVMHSMMLEKTETHAITYETPDRALEIILGESDLNDRIAVTFDERPFLFEDAKALGDHDLMLFFYSAATYRDIYDRKHKIRHDFLYSAGRFHLINRIEKP